MFPKHCPITTSDVKNYVHPPILGLFKDKEFLEPSAVQTAVRLEPPEINIEHSFSRKEPSRASFIVRNVQTLPIRVNILPPQTEYFKVSYQETSWLFPGLTAKAEITFFSDIARHYTDRIRINCFDRAAEHNVLLPINVAPVSRATCDIPSTIDWGRVPINETVEYDFRINGTGEGDVVFLVSVLNCDPDFTVTPQQGVISKYDRKVDVTLAYTPRRYVTSVFHVQIHVPAESETPFLVKCYAECKPELAEVRCEETGDGKKIKWDSDKYQARQSVAAANASAVGAGVYQDADDETRRSHVRSVHDLDLALLHTDGINKLLIRRVDAAAPDPAELRGPLNWYADEDRVEFEQHLRFCFWKAACLRRCNDLAMLRDRTVLGQSAEDIGAPERRAEIDMVREILDDVYQARLVDNAPEYPQFGASCPDGAAIRKRLARDYRKTYAFTPRPDAQDDPWFYRLRAINRFLQAGRAVIQLNRLKKNLRALKQLTHADIADTERRHELAESRGRENIWRMKYKEKCLRMDERKLREAEKMEQEKSLAKGRNKDKAEKKVKMEKKEKKKKKDK